MDADDIEYGLNECLEQLEVSNCPFTDWEKEFLQSASEQFERKGGLSEKQQEILEKIWEKI